MALKVAGDTRGVRRHAVRGGDHHRPPRRSDRGVLRTAARRRPPSGRRGHPPHAGLGRVDARGGAQARAARLCRDRPHLYAASVPGARTIVAAQGARSGRRGRRPGDGRRRRRRAASCVRQPDANGKVGIIGFCSGGRQAYLAACMVPGIDAAVDCWGGGVVVDDPAKLTPSAAGGADRPHRRTSRRPLLGIFGNDDRNPTPSRSTAPRRSSRRLRQDVRVPPLRRRRPRLLLLGADGLPAEQAQDGWAKVFDFFQRHLVASASSASTATAGR